MYEIPLDPVPDQRVTVAIGDQQYILDVHWNERIGGGHYMHVLEVDTTPIAHGLKLVLGVIIGRGIVHPLFNGQGFMMYDSTGSRPAREARLDDLGTTKKLFYVDSADIMLMQAPPLESE